MEECSSFWLQSVTRRPWKLQSSIMLKLEQPSQLICGRDIVDCRNSVINITPWIIQLSLCLLKDIILKGLSLYGALSKGAWGKYGTTKNMYQSRFYEFIYRSKKFDFTVDDFLTF
eukprot:TRINITY_DN17096_c0_g1_i1.p2 TRINITY_DN17096_c0_g1~~TRINITY_DN17096_c0_g1_i1.p2  ORF type:complete len:115 (+),score=23.26 TRINITY_DN17096_c0_g1_i1:71-415(+)